MGDRYTRKDADKAFARLCEELGKPVGHYRECEDGEPSNMANGQRFSTIPGGWVLDYNPTYGGCVIEELSPNPGETWISQPFGATRRSPREILPDGERHSPGTCIVKVCSTCRTVRWPLTHDVRVCPECDGVELIHNNQAGRQPTVKPDTQLQRDVDAILSGWAEQQTPYDWETDGI